MSRDECGNVNPAPYITCNTPPKKGKRPRRVTSDVWTVVRRIRTNAKEKEGDESDLPVHPDAEKANGKFYTHVCMDCWELLTLTKNAEGTWQTTKGTAHLKACKGGHNRMKDKSSSYKKSAAVEEASEARMANSLMAAGLKSVAPRACPSSDLQQQDMRDFVDSILPHQQALSSQARFYAYSNGNVSKSTFDDPYMREMLREQYYAGYKTGSCGVQVPKNYPQLNRKGLKSWIAMEEKIHDCAVELAFELCHKFAEGNPFAQAMHDCATLKNKYKNIAVGAEFVLGHNIAICLAMTPIADGTDQTGATKLREVLSQYTTLDYEEVFHSTVSDRAATGIARAFGHDQDGCGMHDGDKIGRSAIGDLVRTKDKVVSIVFCLCICFAFCLYFNCC